MGPSTTWTNWRSIWAVMLAACVLMLSSAAALADKLHLKDGRVLEGTVVREGDGWVQFKVKVGTVESVQLFTKDDIAKLERTEAPAGGDSPAKSEAPKSGDQTNGEAKEGEVVVRPGVARIAVLNFGPPSSWKGEVDSLVGGVIQAKLWDQAIPMLEKDKVSIVVVRVNSGGGALLELERFHRTFETYKKKFRVVAWIESAISAAAMSPWVIEEFYFLPGGNMGACTGFSGRLNAIKGFSLESVLLMMERAGEQGRRPSPYIMRAMQIQEPLSVDIDENGNVIWRQDENGQVVLNKANRVFTINAEDAVKYKFAKAIAPDLDSLAKAMNLQEWEPAGKAATDFIDRTMRDADKAAKLFVETYRKYEAAVGFARAAQDTQKRGEFIGRARRFLEEMRRMYKDNWLNAAMLGLEDEEWFREQEKMLRELGSRP